MTEPDYIHNEIERARNRSGFMERLRRRVEEDKPILDKLEALEHDEQNAAVDSTMAEIRRLATHEHCYPRPNRMGFPVNQCLDCGRWRAEGEQR